jgi:pyruvyl transferase EpsO
MSNITPNQAHARLMERLKAAHAPLLPLLSGRPLHYLDLPMHGNVGDLLIMAGTLKFFETHRLTPTRTAMYFNYDAGWARSGDVLVFHGGGNFGDIYGPFQAFREHLIASRPDCRIVVMPQSLHFEDPAAFERCRAACAKHPDLHICVRDEHSRLAALQLTPHVYLMPDMAHQLWPLRRTQQGQGVLRLRRRDGESAAAGSSEKSAGSFDWDDLIGPGWKLVLRQIERGVTQAGRRLGARRLFGNWFAHWWQGRADRFVQRAVALFSRYERVESDRLHAHILASLLAMPNRVDDNSYGKNSRYIAAWTHASPLVELATAGRRVAAPPQPGDAGPVAAAEGAGA